MFYFKLYIYLLVNEKVDNVLSMFVYIICKKYFSK